MFSRPLEDELAQLATIRDMARRPWALLQPQLGRLARLDLQIVDGDDTLAALDPATKLAADSKLIDLLRQNGRVAAERWLRRAA